jgi:hypothetical protein
MFNSPASPASAWLPAMTITAVAGQLRRARPSPAAGAVDHVRQSFAAAAAHGAPGPSVSKQSRSRETQSRAAKRPPRDRSAQAGTYWRRVEVGEQDLIAFHRFRARPMTRLRPTGRSSGSTSRSHLEWVNEQIAPTSPGSSRLPAVIRFAGT